MELFVKYIFSVFFIFLVTYAFGTTSPGIYLIKNIDYNSFTLDDGSKWKASHWTLKNWNEGDQVVFIDHPEYGFSVINHGLEESVTIQEAPDVAIVEIEEDSFTLSNGLVLERKSYMTLEIGDRIFLFGWGCGPGVIVYNVTRPWISGCVWVTNRPLS